MAAPAGRRAALASAISAYAVVADAETLGRFFRGVLGKLLKVRLAECFCAQGTPRARTLEPVKGLWQSERQGSIAIANACLAEDALAIDRAQHDAIHNSCRD